MFVQEWSGLMKSASHVSKIFTRRIIAYYDVLWHLLHHYGDPTGEHASSEMIRHDFIIIYILGICLN